MTRTRIPLLLLAIAAVLPACAQADTKYGTEVPTTWEFEMIDPFSTHRSYDLPMVITVNGPAEYYIRLYAAYNKASLACVQDWAWEINRKEKGLASYEGHKLYIHRVLNIEMRAGTQTFRIKQVGPTP